MPNIVPFQFEGQDIPAIQDEQGEPWWRASDVCQQCEIKNVSKACARLDADEKAVITLSDSAGRPNDTLIVNEAGLYTLALGSRKPKAKTFRRWVTHEVLPQIRKTGKYEVSTRGDMLVQMAEAYRDQERRINLLEEEREAQREALLAQQAELIATQQKMIEGFLLAERAETKADIALEDAHRMTVEEYIVKNGDTRQYRPSEYQRISKWLSTFCQQRGIEVYKTPVLGKPWDRENAYPLQAFTAFYRYDQKRPKQITLVKEKCNGK